MKRFVVIPDSFKGAMSSRTVCRGMEAALRRHFPSAQVAAVPVADGGEGTVDCFLAACGGERVELRASGPFGEETSAFYGILPGGTAVIEMAACASLALAGERKRPDEASTCGVGQLLLDAAGRGCRRILLGLGGSCTNDGGAGAAAVCGARFLDAAGRAFVPVGATLQDIRRIDVSGLRERLAGVEIEVLCDIDNPLCGPQGAARVFGPQKGADEAMAGRLDEGLRVFGLAAQAATGTAVLDLPGAGAAGGMGGGMAALFGARLRPGIETVLDQVDFSRLAQGADLVFTGEGRLDGQSLRGKVVNGVARRAKALGVPVVAVVGAVGDGAREIYSRGVRAVFSISRGPGELSDALAQSERNLAETMDNLCRLISAVEGL